MLKELTELYDTTLLMVERIDEIEPDQLLMLLDLRSDVIMKLELQPVISIAEKERLTEIGKFDSLITGRMNDLKEEASQALEKIKQTQIQKKVYEQAYDNAYVTESYFFDQKNN
ncbi:hypothetical protein [Paenibacillus gorillae]|uniref:hypothetical protein n=1 Tax=Paenibacillus gorillae TaxID=1243662 RepID=UPI0005A89AF0|nr:hypothetical protein [Paenibacillus gorillae]